MCSHYEAPEPSRLRAIYGTAPSGYQRDLWPGHQGVLVRAKPSSEQDQRAVEVLPGVFGLLPFWAKDMTLARRTYNARSETVAAKPSFRSAWNRAQHCVIPAVAIYEPDWRSGKAVPTRICRTDGELMNIAGLWDRWTSPAGEDVLSFTMLTINADEHPLMSRYHRPEKEKRMVVILQDHAVSAWLQAPADASSELMSPYPAHLLIAQS